MALVQLGTRDLVRTVTGIARWSADTAELVVSLPGRIGTLLDQVEVLISRIEQSATAPRSRWQGRTRLRNRRRPWSPRQGTHPRRHRP